MSRLMSDGTAEPVSRDQILRRKQAQGKIHRSADHEQNWQPYRLMPGLLLYMMTILYTQTYTSRTGNRTRLIHTLLKGFPTWWLLYLPFTIRLVSVAHVYCTVINRARGGCGKRGAHINWFEPMRLSEKAAPVTRATLRTTGLVPADSR